MKTFTTLALLLVLGLISTNSQTTLQLLGPADVPGRVAINYAQVSTYSPTALNSKVVLALGQFTAGDGGSALFMPTNASLIANGSNILSSTVSGCYWIKDVSATTTHILSLLSSITNSITNVGNITALSSNMAVTLTNVAILQTNITTLSNQTTNFITNGISSTVTLLDLLSKYTNKMVFSNGILVTNITAYGTNVWWDDLMVPGLSVRTGGTAPNWSAFGVSGNLYGYAFVGSATDDQCYFTLQIPHGYLTGSDINPHVHWAMNAASTLGVVWGLEYTWADIGGPFVAPTTIYTTNFAATTNWVHNMTSFASISGVDKGISSMLNCRLFRAANSSASDTNAADAFLLQFDVHYQKDAFGSRLPGLK